MAVVPLIVVTVLVRQHLAFLTDADALRAFIRGYGFWAPLVLSILAVLGYLNRDRLLRLFRSEP